MRTSDSQPESLDLASAAAAPAACARHVRKTYPSRPPVTALWEIDLDLRRGAVTALLGPNGAGKTTLLRILGGLLAPSAGAVEVLGVEQPAMAGGRRRRELRRRLGYIPQELALDPEMTGRETLALLATLYGVPRAVRGDRIAALGAAFGVTAHLPRPVAGWSGGLKRRLHLAAGMIHDPELLLLDEPTAGLDQEGSESLWAELRRRARAGRAIAVATHDLAAAESSADRIALLDGGRLLATGRPGDLAAEHGGMNLAAMYRRLTGRDPEPPPPPGGAEGGGGQGGGGGRRGAVAGGSEAEGGPGGWL